MTMMDVEGNIPLEVAARFNNEHMCKNLLDHVKNKPLMDKLHLLVKRAAHEASEAGNLSILKLIIPVGSNKEEQKMSSVEIERILQIRNEDGYTCLHLAAAQGNIQIFLLMVLPVKSC